MSDSMSVNSDSVAPSCHRIKAWLICISSGLFFFYEFFQLNVFDAINESVRYEFQLNAAQISWMSSAYLWANVVFLLPSGIILDCLSARKVILFALFLCILSTIGFSYAHSFFIASFFHSLAGAGNAFCFLSCVVLINQWFPPQKQAFAVGVIVTMAFLGGMCAHAPFAYLNLKFGWRDALLIDGGAGILLFIWLMLIIEDNTSYLAKRSFRIPRLADFKAALSRQTCLAGLYTSFLNLPIMILCALWGSHYLQAVHHQPEKVAHHIVSLLFVGSIVGCPLAGWISDWMRRRKPMMLLGAAFSFLFVLILSLKTNLSAVNLSFLFFFIGLFTSTQVISYPLIAESNKVKNIGLATALASIMIMGGGGIGQIVFGMLMDAHRKIGQLDYNLADFNFAMWIFPCTTLLALFTVVLLRETFAARS